MPGVKITGLPPQTTPADTDVLPFDFNAATTPVTSKITVANLRSAIRGGQYPAIDANTILAWNFTGASGSIPNLGAAGAGADMVTIGANVARNVPGPVNAGVGIWGTNSAFDLYTAQGAGASLGSASFSDAITALVFVDLGITPDISPAGIQRILLKGYASGSWVAPFAGLTVEFNGNTLQFVLSTVAGSRLTSRALGNASTWGWRTGFHMIGGTYDGTISRLYFDGVEIASTNHGSSSNLVLGAPSEGPWNVGTLYVGPFTEGFRGVVYHARVENVVRGAAWMNQAWRNANGWP